MRIWLRKLPLFALAPMLAASIPMTGCRTQNTTINSQQEPPDYRQWEHDTNRPHVDLDKRSQADQNEFQEWQRTHHH